MSNTRVANIRFNMDIELHRKAWELLQKRDLNKYPTYSHTVIYALTEALSMHESRIGIEEKSEKDQLVSEITDAVDHAVDKAVERILPSFLAGYMAGAARCSPPDYQASVLSEPHSEEMDEEDEATDIDFGFLGLE
jgi:hypothetical protein